MAAPPPALTVLAANGEIVPTPGNFPPNLGTILPPNPAAAATATTFRSIPDLKVPKFDGSTDIDDFLERMATALTLFNVNSVHQKNLFKQYLDPLILAEFQELESNNPTFTLQQLIYLLRKIHLVTYPDQYWMAKLFECAQLEGETGMDYLRKLKRIIQNIRRHTANPLPSGTLLARFIQGAQPEYRKEIRIANIPESELENRVKLIDEEIRQTYSKQKKRKLTPQVNSITEDTADMKAQITTLTDEFRGFVKSQNEFLRNFATSMKDLIFDSKNHDPSNGYKRDRDQFKKKKDLCPIHPRGNHTKAQCFVLRNRASQEPKANGNKTPPSSYDCLQVSNNCFEIPRPKRAKRIMAKLDINNKSLSALVDTGADVSLISANWLRTHLPTINIKRTETILRNASGQPMDIIGYVTLTIHKKPRRMKFYIAENLHHEAILGLDGIRMNNRELNLDSIQIKLKSDPDDFNVIYRVNENITIPAHTGMHFNAYTVANITSIHPWYELPGCFEPNSFKVQKGFQFAHTIIHPREQICCSVINDTDEDLQLKKDQTIGQYNPLELRSYKEDQEDHNISLEDVEQIFKDQESYSHLDKERQQRLRDLLTEYLDVFSNPKNPFTYVTPKYQFTVNTGGKGPIALPPYRVSPDDKKIISDHVEEMLKKGVIEPSQSTWAFPVVLIPKVDGTIRFCIDYRKLNAITVKDKYPLPRIDDLLDATQGHKYFTTLDCAAGYWQIPCPPEERPKLAFICHKGLFQFTRMPFGVSNAPSVFQRTMDEVLSGLKWVICLVYLDDIIVFSKTFEQHLLDLRTVFNRFRNHQFRFKLSKCSFAQKEVDYLGHTISAGLVKLRKRNIAKIKRLIPPRSIKEVQTFLGLTGYYRRFVKNYAKIASSLTLLIRKGQKFFWGRAQQLAWQSLKDALISDPILRHPDFKRIFILQTDASDDGVGVVLTQKDDNGDEYVIGYASRLFQGAEKNWHTQEKEAFAILYGIEQFRVYLYGRHFIIQTDHASLRWLFNVTRPGRLSRWSLTLSEYDFELQHRSGTSNGNADALSRLPVIQEENELEINLIYSSNFEFSIEDREEIKTRQKEDLFLNDIIRYHQGQSSDLTSSRMNTVVKCQASYKIRDDILYKKFPPKRNSTTVEYRIAIPVAMAPTLINRIHNLLTHVNWKKTYQFIRSRFHWRGMQGDVRERIAHCDVCQRRRPGPVLTQGNTQSIQPTKPWEIIGIDFVGPLPTQPDGSKFICVLIDWFTGWPEAFATSGHSAEEVLTILVQEVFPRYGVPKTLVSDNASEFMSNICQQLLNRYNIEHRTTTYYHPQGNSPTERFNRFLKAHLNPYGNLADHTQWSQWLPTLLLAYRATVHEATGDTPFYLMHGRDIRLPLDNVFGTFNPTAAIPDVRDFKQTLHRQLDSAINTAQTQRRLQANYNRRLRDQRQRAVTFEETDLVYLFEGERLLAQRSTSGIPTISGTLPKWTGPWRVLRVLSPLNYRVEHLSTGEVRNAHIQRLQRARI